MLNKHTFVVACVVFVIQCLANHQAEAQTTLWTDGGNDGSFFNPANWTAGVPEQGIDARFLLNTTYSVKVVGGAEAGDMIINNGQMSLIGGGELNVAHARLLSGEHTITELGTRLRSDSDLVIGNDIDLGDETALTVTDRGDLSMLGDIFVQQESHLVVEGATFDGINLFLGIGNMGLGTFTARFDAGATLTNVTIGVDPLAEGIFTVDGSIVQILEDLVVGDGGPGELVVRNFGFVGAGGSTLVSGGSRMEIGNGAQLATSTIDCRGALYTTGDAKIIGDLDLKTPGFAELENLEISGDYKNDGVHSLVGTPGGIVTIGGTYSGATDFLGNGLVRFEGLVQPGNSSDETASVSFDSNRIVFTAGSILEIEIGSDSVEGYDQICTNSYANILSGSTLNIVPVNGFQFKPGQSFTIIKRNSSFPGGFAGMPEGAVIGTFNGMDLTISYEGGEGNNVVLSVESDVLLGDINLDGNVNLLDVAPFVDLVSNGTFQAEADINQDGVVNLLDVAPFVAILGN